MDHMRISGTEPTSVNLSQTKYFKSWNVMPKMPKQAEAKTKLQFQSIFNTENFYALKTLRINGSRP